MKTKRQIYRQSLKGFLSGFRNNPALKADGMTKEQAIKKFKIFFEKAWPKWQADPKGMFKKFGPKKD